IQWSAVIDDEAAAARDRVRLARFATIAAALWTASCLPIGERPSRLEFEDPFAPPRPPLAGALLQAAHEADRIDGLKSLLVSFRGETALERYYNGAGPYRATNV